MRPTHKVNYDTSTDTSLTVLQQGLYCLLIHVIISGNFC